MLGKAAFGEGCRFATSPRAMALMSAAGLQVEEGCTDCGGGAGPTRRRRARACRPAAAAPCR